MNGPWGHYAKWNESDKDKYSMILLICGILKNQMHKIHRRTDWWLPEVGGMKDGWNVWSCSKGRTYSYKFSEYNVQYGDYN